MLTLFIIIIAIVLFTWYVIRNLHNPQDEDDIELPPSEPQLKPASPSPSIKVVVGGGSDAPVQNLKYFCVKDKGYHVSVWPKVSNNWLPDIDFLEFNIAGMSYRDNIDNYLGECVGTLEPEPTNEYDPNAIKVLANDGHHVGYVPMDQTQHVRNFTTLPCPCYIYIGKNDEIYFSDCYINNKKP
jgi:hypothetical protein